ncbi:tyrosine-type recombinase/integrase [Streptomyces sp. SPB074]|uniref:tyrosine-type recombinase/integrase n=1 Tax=Streptomyces sp. (strain SPB074) TaxID=465543 RepID=UPI00017FE9AD|nr:site-specific integrase [Streptomyces sp. SPB074]EDY43598.1 phage integrase family site-specific recombinase [Streptomyces sp. SPB074]
MSTVIKRCDHTESQWARCKHSWVVRWRTVSGPQAEESFPYNRKTEANALAIKVEHDKKMGVYEDRKQSQRSFDDCWKEWLKFGNREPSTISQYEGLYKNHYWNFFKDRRIGSIVHSDLVKWEDDQKRRGYKGTGIKTRLVILKSFLKYCYDADIVPRYAAKGPRMGRRDDVLRTIGLDEIPTTGEIIALQEAMRPELKATIWIQAGCGLRVGEALAFSESHLTRKPGWYFVQNQLTTFGANSGAGRGTGVKAEPKWDRYGRWVPVGLPVGGVLQEHKRLYTPWGEAGWYFESPTRAGHHPSRTTYTNRWNEAIEKAGLKEKGYTPKSLRHYFASMAIAGGVPVWEIAKWMGHKSTETTETVYAHVMVGAEKRISTAFEEALAINLRERFATAA